ncbi:MAG: hypothetical protein N2654_07080, partial [Deltaproteobacteria bacterium]|nr:hypothetical protein [Deltaproteobacteria bacterium]
MQEAVQQSKKTKSRYSIFAPPRIRPFYAKGLRIDLERLLMSSFVEKSTVEFVKALKLPIHPIIADYDYSSLVDALKVDYRI